MFFILSKILFYLILPLTWIIAILLVALLVKRQKLKIKLFTIAAVLLLIFTNPFLANEAWLWWEVPPTPINQVGQYDAAIILTGITNPDKSPHDRVYINRGADRVLHPLQLYRLGKADKLIITGGSGSLTDKQNTEAGELKKILLMAAVPEEDILIEDRSRNTRENALFTKELLQQHPELQKLLVVTSAFHMRRAAGCFEKVGVEADYFSTDFYTRDRSFTPDALLAPDVNALHEWQKLFHEIAGYVMYKLMGYI
ncbi:MAG: YdcF family protein [Hymenobacteraceae bacterium]|nr:YdcF family protein [Hymenobacteraceae bacterium]MDX5395151.1 YdcF family protein [Hymenobacteraceae bacterium]MDX5511192.1 YdcF family protein [Hymenobacteraceae bacterium]